MHASGRGAKGSEPHRRLSLGTVLTAVNVGLVAAAVVCLVAAAAGLLRRLTDEQALSRASLASATALSAIERAGEQTRASARLLAGGASLGALLQQGDRRGLQDLLSRFRRTNSLSGCAVLSGGDLLAHDGVLAWGALARQRRAPDDRFVLRPESEGPLVLGAWAPVASIPGTFVATVIALDEGFAGGVSREVGLPITILD